MANAKIALLRGVIIFQFWEHLVKKRTKRGCVKREGEIKANKMGKCPCRQFQRDLFRQFVY